MEYKYYSLCSLKRGVKKAINCLLDTKKFYFLNLFVCKHKLYHRRVLVDVRVEFSLGIPKQ